MNLCSNSHEEVCYETNICPACDYGNTKYEEGYADGYDENNKE